MLVGGCFVAEEGDGGAEERLARIESGPGLLRLGEELEGDEAGARRVDLEHARRLSLLLPDVLALAVPCAQSDSAVASQDAAHYPSRRSVG